MKGVAMKNVAQLEVVTDLEHDEQKTLDSILKAIHNPPVNSRVFTITPMIAAALLRDFNEGNRPMKPRNIARYADDMLTQRWPLTGDTLKFSDMHRLRDGQNRAAACVRAGVPFKTHIVFGIDDAAFDRLDQGRNRNGADVLHIHGVTNSSVVSGAVRWAHLIGEGRAKQRDTYPPAEIRRLFDERYSGLSNFVRESRAIYETGGHPQSLVVAVLYHLHKKNPAKAAEFSTAWQTSKWDGKFKPIALMQTRIATMRASTSGRVHDVVRAALIIKAWNIFAAGRKGRAVDMTWDPSLSFPEIDG
jgi:hypothetical protein